MGIFVTDKTTGQQFEAPSSSSELFLNTEKYRKIWGDDVFFILGTLRHNSEPDFHNDGALSDGADILYELQQEISYQHHKLKNVEDPKSRALANYIAEHPEKFSELENARANTSESNRRYLLSLGGIAYFKGKLLENSANETRALLLERTKPAPNAGMLTGANGLAEGPLSDEMELAEEYTLVTRHPSQPYTFTVHVLQFDDSKIDQGALLKIKQEQLETIKKNLVQLGYDAHHESARFDFSVMHMHKTPGAEMGLPQNRLTIVATDDDGNKHITSMQGYVGVEHRYNTLLCHHIGMVDIASMFADGTEIIPVDGEFDRPVRFYATLMDEPAIASTRIFFTYHDIHTLRQASNVRIIAGGKSVPRALKN